MSSLENGLYSYSCMLDYSSVSTGTHRALDTVTAVFRELKSECTNKMQFTLAKFIPQFIHCKIETVGSPTILRCLASVHNSEFYIIVHVIHNLITTM